MKHRKTYTLEQYRSDCAALSGTDELEDVIPVSGVVRRNTVPGLADALEPASQRWPATAALLAELEAEAPSKPVNDAVLIAAGLGMRPSGRVR